jgi:hypothetical protein
MAHVAPGEHHNIMLMNKRMFDQQIREPLLQRQRRDRFVRYIAQILVTCREERLPGFVDIEG